MHINILFEKVPISKNQILLALFKTLCLSITNNFLLVTWYNNKMTSNNCKRAKDNQTNRNCIHTNFVKPFCMTHAANIYFGKMFKRVNGVIHPMNQSASKSPESEVSNETYLLVGANQSGMSA